MISQSMRQWLIPALIALMASALAGYFHNDKELTARVTAVEHDQRSDHESIIHTRDQVDKLVEWALGHK